MLKRSNANKVYYPTSAHRRACKHWWFGAWDRLVNAALRAIGPPRIVTRSGEIAIDPHIHTMFSRCSISRPDLVLLKAAARGLGGIAVLDHDNPKGIAETEYCCEFLKEKGLLPADFILITGLEISSTAGHIGALFVRDLAVTNASPSEVIRRIHEACGLAVAVHPFDVAGIGEALFDLPIDAVETCCGSVFHSPTARANLELATETRLASVAKLGASDAHYLGAIGSCYTICQVSELTPEAVKQAILSGKTRPVSSAQHYRISKVLASIAAFR